MDDGNNDSDTHAIEKAKGTKKCERTLKFNGYENCLLNNDVILKLQQKFKSEPHDVYTKELTRLH